MRAEFFGPEASTCWNPATMELHGQRQRPASSAMKIYRDSSNRNRQLCWGLILFFVGLHLLYINTPFVNLEWVYRQGSQYFITQEQSSVELYFSSQANPLTYSYLSSIAVRIFGDTYLSYRLFALIGGTLLLALLARHNNPWLILLVGLNPLIWIYSGRAYSELLSVGVMLLAFETRGSCILRGVWGGLAATVKYHAIVVNGVYWGLQWLRRTVQEKQWVWRDANLQAAAISLFGLVVFLLFYMYQTNIWIAPEKFQVVHGSIQFDNWLNNFYSYGFYLSGMFFLTIPAHLQNIQWRWHAVALSISIPLAISNQNLGEMDFGSFDQLLSNEIILLIKVAGFWNFLLCCKQFWQDKESRIMLLTILIYITMLSLTKPVQRYLIFVIPFWAILVCSHIRLHRLFWWGFVISLCGLNGFASLYQVSNAQASADIARWSVQNNLYIDAGVIHSHVGEYSHQDAKSELIVRLTPKANEKILFQKPVKVLGHTIRNYIVVQTHQY